MVNQKSAKSKNPPSRNLSDFFNNWRVSRKKVKSTSEKKPLFSESFVTWNPNNRMQKNNRCCNYTSKGRFYWLSWSKRADKLTLHTYYPFDLQVIFTHQKQNNFYISLRSLQVKNVSEHVQRAFCYFPRGVVKFSLTLLR